MKKYENLIKLCLVLGLATLIIGLIILFVIPLPYTEEFINRYLGIMFGIFGFFVIAYLVLMIFAPKSVRNNLFKASDTDDPYKVCAEYHNFDEINSKIISELKRKKYKRYEPNNEYNRSRIFIYYKYFGLTTRIYMVIYADNEELSPFLDEVSELLYLTLNNKVKWCNFYTFVTSVLCVDKTSDAFYEHFKSAYLAYSGYDFEVKTGYSFNNRTLYIGKSPYGSFGISQIKKLRKKLLDMLGIPKDLLKK